MKTDIDKEREFRLKVTGVAKNLQKKGLSQKEAWRQARRQVRKQGKNTSRINQPAPEPALTEKASYS